MSYIHDLTTTALNLIDAKNSLEYGSFLFGKSLKIRNL